MLAELLDQAAALERIAASSAPLGRERLTALLECCDRLAVLGESRRALELLEMYRVQGHAEGQEERTLCEVTRVRALLGVQQYREGLSAAQIALEHIPYEERGTRIAVELRLL